MTNDKKILKMLQRKLIAEKFKDELLSAYEMIKSKEKQDQYNDEMVKKTWNYQKKYDFETSSQKGHEFWNNEADAFKHTFGSADMTFKYGENISKGAGIRHEWQTKNNPRDEWNMDSWNNAKGREIAQEIKREYGDKFYEFSQQQQDNIIAEKVMEKMRNGELITKPSDTREYNNKFEDFIYKLKKSIDSITGSAAPVKPFTREQIGAMTPEEYHKNEKAIMDQWGKMGIPSERDLHKEKQSETNKESRVKKSEKSSNSSKDGKWVTINGNHVLIKD